MHLLLRFPASGGQSGYFRREHGFRKRPKDGMGAGWRREKQGFLHPIREHARFARCAKSYVSSGTIISNKQSCFAGEQSSSRFPSWYPRVRVPSPAPKDKVERRQEDGVRVSSRISIRWRPEISSPYPVRIAFTVSCFARFAPNISCTSCTRKSVISCTSCTWKS